MKLAMASHIVLAGTNDPLDGLGQIINDLRDGLIQESNIEDAAVIAFLENGVEITPLDEIYKDE